MQFTVVADTDIGISKDTNQDSVLVKHASSDIGEVLMAIICDGMGGLSKGELASATVIREFDRWFNTELPYRLDSLDLGAIGNEWTVMLKNLNEMILYYGDRLKSGLGTTFSGILFVNNQYVVAHVGDSRIYRIGTVLGQMTTDQTFVAREIALGNMTPEQAKVDKRRNLLLQCVGASRVVEPEVFCGVAERGAYMLCSDGFRHEITEGEIYGALNHSAITDKNVMRNNVRYLIEQVKTRQEKDNISVILIKAD